MVLEGGGIRSAPRTVSGDQNVSIIRAVSHDKYSDRRWMRVVLATLLLLGATVLAAQESHSYTAPDEVQRTAE